MGERGQALVARSTLAGWVFPPDPCAVPPGRCWPHGSVAAGTGLVSILPCCVGGLQPGGAFVLKQGATELRQLLWWPGWEPLPFLPPAGELDP